METYVVGNETFNLGPIDLEVEERINLDAALGIPPGKSMEYTPDMLEHRRYFEAWMKSLPPNAIIDFPQLS